MNTKLLAAFLLALSAVPSHAGEYTDQKVRIVNVKANADGNCFGRMKGGGSWDSPDQGFTWSCNNTWGRNLLSLANLAYLTNSPVNITLIGNGADYKPLRAIELVAP